MAYRIKTDDVNEPEPLIAKFCGNGSAPVLVLEDVKPEPSYVDCLPDIVSIGFLDARSPSNLASELERRLPFTLITSHDGCNEDGARGIRE